jgi:Winged helix-turn helix
VLGQGRDLTPDQDSQIQKIIIDKRPEQLKIDFFLWSTAALAQLILRETVLTISERSTGKYLKRWGFSPKKPIKRAYEQSPKAVQSWLDEQYPAIQERACAEGVEISWGAETALVNTDNTFRSFAPKGKARWMIIDESFNSDRLIEFMESLVKDACKKVFLILDNLRVHRSQAREGLAAGE